MYFRTYFSSIMFYVKRIKRFLRRTPSLFHVKLFGLVLNRFYFPIRPPANIDLCTMHYYFSCTPAISLQPFTEMSANTFLS